MSDTLDYYLPFRGDLKAAVGVGSSVAFVTVHPEGRLAGLNWNHLGDDRPRWEMQALPGGGAAVVANGETVWVGGGDGQVYRGSVDEAPKPVGPKFASAPKALTLLSGDRLGVLVGAELTVLSRADGAVKQTFPLAEPGTALASDPSGRWLAAGTVGGTVAVFEAENAPEFAASDSARLHDGEVTALLFERDDLRFFSTGADLKLLSTHARGRLEPEDKGRGNAHTDRVTAMIWGPEDRFFTGSRDGTVKSWPRVGAVKPVTQKDGVVKVVALALLQRHGRDHLVVGGEDNTLRTFTLDPAGKIHALVLRGHDALAWARADLAGDDPRARELALRRLAEYDDTPSLEMLADQVGRDADHGLRLLAAQLLGGSDHPRADARLEALFAHPDAAVRTAAFAGLQRRRGVSDLRTLDLALKAEKPEIGKLAVEALQVLAEKDDQALTRLTSALSAKTPEIRQAALIGLEAVYPPDSPEANLTALGSGHADVRRSALLRLSKRGLLNHPAVQAALRRRTEDADSEVRRAAFLLTLHTRPPLLQALRGRDPELARQLADLDGKDGTPAPAEEPKKGRAEVPSGADQLTADDLAPLLQAAASRSLDTSLRGARGLAILGDPRAFGLLLQLSREEDKEARVEVCRAMGALDDPRAVERLRSLLFDPEPAGRDAAFTALARLHQADPLRAAQSGLLAPSEDVRRRGLQLLLSRVREAPPRDADDPAWAMLAAALNDSFPSIRAEAFKAALNLKVGGGGPKTLRFALRSLHADVRLEALTEAMASIAEPGGWDVVLEFFNDPEPTLRSGAFEFAAKKSKGLEILDAALGSRYPDLRKVAVAGLVKKHTAAAQKLLARAVEDDDREVRLAALASLVESDALPALIRAIESPHADVRLRAAKALARHGDPAALEPLLALATAPEPPEAERRKDWLDLAESALDGLGELGDPSALTALIPLVDSPHAALRQRATQAMAWVSGPETMAPLRDALRHDDPQVKYRAALGLAYEGDASAGPMVFSEAAAKILSAGERLAAALALSGSASGEGQLIAALDDKSEKVRSRALLLLLMLEWKSPHGKATRCLAALSSREARTRLVAAEAIEALAEPSGFAAFVVRLVNDRGDKPPWTIPSAAVDDLAELLVHAESRLRARTARLLRHLDADEQAAWDQGWALHASRFAQQIAALRQQAAGRKAPRLQETPESLRELAFGAYVGLVREQGGTRKSGSEPAVIRVRQTALGRLLALAKSDPKAAEAARPVLVQALGDPNATVRLPAFEALPTLGMAPADLAAEALATGHVDLGIKGLEILAAGGTTDEGRRVLDDAMLSRRDDLAIEAARLLIAREGTVAVAGRALEAAHGPLRRQAVSWLVAEYDQDASARDLLRDALSSRYAAIREAAALSLSTKKDPAAFDALVALLKAAPSPNAGRPFLQALVTLGDPRTSSALLDRVEDDPAGTAPVDEAILAVGQFRRPEVADRLFALMDKDRKRSSAIVPALLAISGHDQPMEDPKDEGTDRRWEELQFPRRDDLLARLLAKLSGPGEKGAASLVPAARWSRSQSVDPVLAGLVSHPDEGTRRAAIEALGWRLRKRDGNPAPLVEALATKDPVAQFLAAEGLARAGHAEGISVLLAGVEFLGNLDFRRRAVLALGELADERAVDLLMKLAAEDGHALQDVASEAIGHLGRSKHAEAIARLLERHVRAGGSVLDDALKGLRWLDTASGWRLIRDAAADRLNSSREVAIEQLAYNDDPATRDLLLRMLANDDDAWDVLEPALAAARKLWGPDALDPDEAVLQNGAVQSLDEFDEVMRRVSERGVPSRIFAILPKCYQEVRETLARAVLARPTLPIAEAKAAIGSPEPAVCGLAARILGRAGAAARDAGPAVESALVHRWATWRERLRDASRKAESDADGPVPLLAECLRHLAWAAGRLGVGGATLVDMAGSPAEDREAASIREAAVAALAASPPEPSVVGTLESAAESAEPELRALAAQAVTDDDPARAAALAERLISDRASFDRIARREGGRLVDVLRRAVRQVHYQGVVLPYLVGSRDVVALAEVAEDRNLSEAARLGAIGGLAAMAIESADAVLIRIGRDEKDDEDLRKAAWRGLRRSKRAKQKPSPARAEVDA